MNKSLKPPSAHQIAAWLEAEQYERVLNHCEQFLKGKIRAYLRNFPAHYQNQHDFFQEIYLHLLTKTFPSKSFREACNDEHKFRHYFTRAIFNQLNTLLQRERNHQRGTVDWEKAISPMEDEYESADKASWLEDKAQNNSQESKQLLGCLRQRFMQFMQQFQLLFPKIAPKLALLLKLTARAEVTIADLKHCFGDISQEDAQALLNAMRVENNYQDTDDLAVFEMFKPYFEKYRGEVGNAQSIQRWLNQHISGDRGKKGILEYMKIKDGAQMWEVQDKRVFTDFLHYHYTVTEATQEQAARATSPATEKKKSFWQRLFPSTEQPEMATYTIQA